MNEKACKLIKKGPNKILGKSKQHFDNEIKNNPSYTTKSHRNWANEYNYGCTHLGLHPKILPRDMLRLDTFHMIFQITKMIMHFIRDQLRKERFELGHKMLTLLGTKWNEWDLSLWG